LAKKKNRYLVVHEIAEDAKQNEIRERDPLKQSEMVPTVNNIKEKRNFVKESFDKIVTKNKKKP
jgi:hypothetical protein